MVGCEIKALNSTGPWARVLLPSARFFELQLRQETQVLWDLVKRRYGDGRFWKHPEEGCPPPSPLIFSGPRDLGQPHKGLKP